MEMPIDMQHQAMGYDRTATMFSPEGHLLQVEYAEKTIRLGSASLGMVCSDGVFILADKRVNDKLVVKQSASKISEIDSHIVASVAGIISDARVLIERAQLIAQQNRITYDSAIEPELVIKEIANIKQQFTQYGGARPFGASIMIAGINSGKPELFVSDVTGNYFSYYANAIGENDDKIKDRLKEEYIEGITIKEGIKIALKTFQEIKGEKFDINKFEIGYVKIKGKNVERREGKEIEKIE